MHCANILFFLFATHAPAFFMHCTYIYCFPRPCMLPCPCFFHALCIHFFWFPTRALARSHGPLLCSCTAHADFSFATRPLSHSGAPLFLCAVHSCMYSLYPCLLMRELTYSYMDIYVYIKQFSTYNTFKDEEWHLSG